eukprot:6205018-Pleurochrysis_carterae.AAC.4
MQGSLLLPCSLGVDPRGCLSSIFMYLSGHCTQDTQLCLPRPTTHDPNKHTETVTRLPALLRGRRSVATLASRATPRWRRTAPPTLRTSPTRSCSARALAHPPAPRMHAAHARTLALASERVSARTHARTHTHTHTQTGTPVHAHTLTTLLAHTRTCTFAPARTCQVRIMRSLVTSGPLPHSYLRSIAHATYLAAS